MRVRAFSFVIVCLLVLPAVAAHVSASHAATRSNASAVVATYSNIFNTGMKSGDFAALASVFAPDATFTRSNPQGVTKVYHGLKHILAAYAGIYKMFTGYQWTIDSMRSLDQSVVLAYEHAGSPPQKVAGRCMHVFVIQGGKITSYDWTTFYPGVQ